jgi:hypothetical protein
MMRAGICAGLRTADQSGKVFRVEQGMRRCMVCDQLFTRDSAAQHANVACWPEKQFWFSIRLRSATEQLSFRVSSWSENAGNQHSPKCSFSIAW